MTPDPADAALRARLADVRAAAAALRAALERDAALPPSASAERSPAHELTLVLAERDRRHAALQREADERLALLERVTQAAEERLRIIAEQGERIQQVEAELLAVQAAADERLALVDANHLAHTEFRAALRGRLRDLLDALGD